MKRKVEFLLVTLFLVMLFLTRCFSQPPEIYLGDKTCRPPCWYGLTPGQTTIAESEAILRSLPFVSPTLIKTKTSPGEETGIGWVNEGTEGGYNHLIFDMQGRISEIRLSTPGLRLGMVIDAFKSPDSVWTSYYTLDGNLLYEVLLFYPNLGITARVVDEPKYVPGKNTERLTRDLQVDQIQFYEPMSVEAFLAYIDHHSKESTRYYLDSLQSWPGFGEDVVRVELPY